MTICQFFTIAVTEENTTYLHGYFIQNFHQTVGGISQGMETAAI